MSSHAADLARRLARDAEAVCRHYLSNGHREGRYWLVGDVANTPGRSLFVRLSGPDSGKGAAGKWTDAATGEHGDLLDLIALQSRPRSLARRARRGALLPQPAAARPGVRPARDRRRRRADRPKPRAVSSPCRSRLRARSPKRICADAALRLCTQAARCASIRAATTAPMPTPDRDLAGADRRGHRSRRQDHRRAPHLARSVRPATRRRSTRRGGRWAISSGMASASAWRTT